MTENLSDFPSMFIPYRSMLNATARMENTVVPTSRHCSQAYLGATSALLLPWKSKCGGTSRQAFRWLGSRQVIFSVRICTIPMLLAPPWNRLEHPSKCSGAPENSASCINQLWCFGVLLRSPSPKWYLLSHASNTPGHDVMQKILRLTT